MFILPFIALFHVAISVANDLFDQADGCLDSNKTYIVNIHSHLQSDVRDALVSIASKINSDAVLDEVQDVAGQKASVAATKSYLGTIIEELNQDLERFNVQINLVFQEHDLDEISAIGGFDPSCEVIDTLKERVMHAFSELGSRLNNNVGIHLFLYSCIYKKPGTSLIFTDTKSNCGKLIGVLWDGSTHTKTLIKSAIIEAFSGMKDAYADGRLYLASKNIMCGFFEKCVGMTPTVHGQLLNYKKVIRYTQNDASDYNEDFLQV